MLMTKRKPADIGEILGRGKVATCAGLPDLCRPLATFQCAPYTNNVYIPLVSFC